MQNISQEQMKQMHYESFAAKLWGILQASQGYGHRTPHKFKEFAARNCKLAASYSLLDELSQARFAYAAWMLGENFDTRVPVIHEILSSKDLPPEIKSKAVINFVTILFDVLSEPRS